MKGWLNVGFGMKSPARPMHWVCGLRIGRYILYFYHEPEPALKLLHTTTGYVMTNTGSFHPCR